MIQLLKNRKKKLSITNLLLYFPSLHKVAPFFVKFNKRFWMDSHMAFVEHVHFMQCFLPDELQPLPETISQKTTIFV